MPIVFLLLLALLAPALPLHAQRGTDTLTHDRIFVAREFAGAGMPSVQWLRDGTSFVRVRRIPDGGSEILRVNAATGREQVLSAADRLVDERGDRLVVERVTFSADETQALLYHSSVQVWRQFTRGRYHVLDLRTGSVRPISRDPGLQMFAKFSPDGRMVAFVRANDLHVTDLATGAERRLTTDGSDDIINGTTDWVYEEELGLRDAFRWSPDSRRIAYWRFDQSEVPAFPIVRELTLYPTVQWLRYPKAGEPNSRVRVGVVPAAGGSTTWLDVGPDTGIYIARMDWVDADSLTVQRLPRRQNRNDLLMVSATSGRGRTILSETDDAWVSVDDHPTWLAGGRQFIWASERSGWRQLYLHDRSGRLVRQLTSDGADVSSLAAVDERRGFVYVIEAAPEPRHRNLIRYSLRGGGRTALSGPGGTTRVDIAPQSRYAVVYHSTANTPARAELHELPAMRRVRVMEENAELARRLRTTAIRPMEFFRIPLEGGDSLEAYRILPPDFQAGRRYPVLMYVYGGPGSQTVTDAFGGERYMWHQLMAQKGYVVVSVDNRGTGARGREFRKQVYLNLGHYEVTDQVAAARWLAEQPWVDGSRIGIWGWSYGGYVAALAAGVGGDVFRVAVAVAPVTDWRLYDTIYTERYMWLPQENERGYDESSALRHVQGITGRLLLVHGTVDDNVHLQHVTQMAARMQDAGKQFDLMLYPNRDHAITGGNARSHLYGMITAFLEREL